MSDGNTIRGKVIDQLAEMQRQLDEMKKATARIVKEQDAVQASEICFQQLFAMAQTLANRVEVIMPYKIYHHRRVADLARAIATEMNLSRERIHGICLAGVLHDMGMISVDLALINKPIRFTEEEFELVKAHVQAGFDYLKRVDFPWPVARMVMEHHERMNGSGYPNGLTGEKLLLESKILVVADVVDAIASHRPYRPALGVDSALYDIAGERGILYDMDVANACLLLFNEKGYKLLED
jgi:HD-GYP domain-containing protein (c-di-GMP phosphodiesterase class II)